MWLQGILKSINIHMNLESETGLIHIETNNVLSIENDYLISHADLTYILFEQHLNCSRSLDQYTVVNKPFCILSQAMP